MTTKGWEPAEGAALVASVINPRSEITANWIENRTKLRFVFGGTHLHSAWLPAITQNLRNSPTTPVDLPPPLQLYPRHVRVALIDSYPVESRLARLFMAPELIRYVPNQYRRFYIDLEGTFGDYLKRLSAHHRHEFRRKVKKFAAAQGGKIQWAEFRKPREMREYHTLSRAVSNKSYQENLLNAGLPGEHEFLNRMTELAANDAVRGYILFNAGAPIAYQYCYVCGNTLVCERMGYDMDFAKVSPGITLLYLVLEHLFSLKQFSRYDFGKGELPYKEAFATGCCPCADMYYFRRTPANLALILAHSTVDLTGKFAGDVLGYLQLRNRIKRFVRLHYGSGAGRRVSEV